MAIVHAGVPVEVVLDERSAGFFALGWAKAARAPVALVCTSGSAGAHYLPAVIEACESGVALVLVTADRPPELQGIGAPQTTRQSDLFAGHSKGIFSVGAADDDGSQMQVGDLDELLALAGSGKPGPVHLNIGFREPLWEPTPAPVETDRPSPPDRREAVATGGIELPDAERGVLVVGPVQEACPEADEAVESLARLAEGRGWPVLADIASGLRHGRAADRSRLHGYDLFLRSGAARAELRPELVIHAGRLPTSRTLFSWLQALEDDGVAVLHLSTDGQPHSLGRSPRIVEMTWSRLARACRQAPPPPRDGHWLARWQTAEHQTAVAVDGESDTAGLWEGAVARVAAAMPDGSNLVLASGMPIRDVDSFVAGLSPGTRCLVNRGVNGIDGLIATAAGVAAHDPGRRVRLILGDLAFLHDAGSLAVAAARPNLDIVVINNGGGGIFEFLPISQAGDVFEKFFLTPQRTDISRVAAAYGIEASRCTSLGKLEECLTAPLHGPRVAEVVVERSHNVYIHKRISSAVVARLDQAFHSEETDGKGSGAGRRSLESRKGL